MQRRSGPLWALFMSAGLLLAACGGEEPPAAGTPAVTDPAAGPPAVPVPGPVGPVTEGTPVGGAPAAPATPQGAAAPPVAGAQAGGGEEIQEDMVLQREVFSYGGAGRDPFVSLLRSGEVRPFLSDLRVTAINFNDQYPVNSVAVLRDTTVNQRYAVRVGDQLGRLRVSAIRRYEVVLVYQEFGRELQDTLRIQRRQGGEP